MDQTKPNLRMTYINLCVGICHGNTGSFRINKKQIVQLRQQHPVDYLDIVVLVYPIHQRCGVCIINNFDVKLSCGLLFFH
ncbi:MAG: hypothetical protein ACI8PW_001491 [Methylophilaceae bacterium]|jgi:hypothetical protein